MVNEISIHIAKILGPVLMVVSSSEFLNFKIWNKVEPAIVSLNGMVLFIFGVAILSFHNIWKISWVLMVTVFGWLLCFAGAYRMYFPSARQAGKGATANTLLICLFLMGLFLTVKGYIN